MNAPGGSHHSSPTDIPHSYIGEAVHNHMDGRNVSVVIALCSWPLHQGTWYGPT